MPDINAKRFLKSKMASYDATDDVKKEGKFRLDLWTTLLVTSVFLISGGFVTSSVFLYYDLEDLTIVDADLQTEIDELQRKLDNFRPPPLPHHPPRDDIDEGSGVDGGVWESADIKDFVDRITEATIAALRANELRTLLEGERGIGREGRDVTIFREGRDVTTFNVLYEYIINTTAEVIDKACSSSKNGTCLQGPAGEEGPRGRDGLNGTAGPPGLNGTQGPQGENGTQGLPGPKGDTGPVGDKGDRGANGTQGKKGITGREGFKGAEGSKGPKGDKGDIGEAGPNGSGGINGTRGLQGIPGVAGSPGSNGEKGEKGDVGLKGEPGADTYNTGPNCICDTTSSVTPQIHRRRRNLPVALGEELVINCDIRTKGMTSLVRRSDGERLPLTLEGKYVVMATTKADYGDYTCTTEHGNSVTSETITILMT